MPFRHHTFGYILAKKSPPNTAMFTGLQSSLFTVGEARHADEYHHVHSYSLFGRDDVYILGLDLHVNDQTDPSAYERCASNLLF